MLLVMHIAATCLFGVFFIITSFLFMYKQLAVWQKKRLALI